MAAAAVLDLAGESWITREYGWRKIQPSRTGWAEVDLGRRLAAIARAWCQSQIQIHSQSSLPNLNSVLPCEVCDANRILSLFHIFSSHFSLPSPLFFFPLPFLFFFLVRLALVNFLLLWQRDAVQGWVLDNHRWCCQSRTPCSIILMNGYWNRPSQTLKLRHWQVGQILQHSIAFLLLSERLTFSGLDLYRLAVFPTLLMDLLSRSLTPIWSFPHGGAVPPATRVRGALILPIL